MPSDIFQDRSYSILETLVVYLKESQGLKYSEIGELLNRNGRTIWTCYHRALKKQRKPFEKFPQSILIPLRIFRNRSVSFSEALVKYLKDSMHLSYHDIGILLNRNERTIWTLYARLKKKKGVAGGAL